MIFLISFFLFVYLNALAHSYCTQKSEEQFIFYTMQQVVQIVIRIYNPITERKKNRRLPSIIPTVSDLQHKERTTIINVTRNGPRLTTPYRCSRFVCPTDSGTDERIVFAFLFYVHSTGKKRM